MLHHEMTKEGLKAAPPVIVSATQFMGFALQEWVYIITIVYTLTLIARSLPKTGACIVCFWKHRACDRKCKV